MGVRSGGKGYRERLRRCASVKRTQGLTDHVFEHGSTPAVRRDRPSLASFVPRPSGRSV